MRRLPGWLDWRPWGFVSVVEGILVGRHRVHFKLLPDCQCTSEPGAPWRVSTSLVCVCILVTAAVRGLVTINPNWSQEGMASITVKAAQLRSATLFDTLHAPPSPGHRKQNRGQLVATKLASFRHHFEPSWQPWSCKF